MTSLRRSPKASGRCGCCTSAITTATKMVGEDLGRQRPGGLTRARGDPTRRTQTLCRRCPRRSRLCGGGGCPSYVKIDARAGDRDRLARVDRNRSRVGRNVHSHRPTGGGAQRARVSSRAARSHADVLVSAYAYVGDADRGGARSLCSEAEQERGHHPTA